MSAVDLAPGAAPRFHRAPRRGLGLLFRDSIALRVSLAVFGGLVLTQLVGFLLITGERLHVLPAMDSGSLAAILDRTLARVHDLGSSEAVLDPGVAATFAADFAPTGEVFDPPPIHALRMQLMAQAAGRYDLLLVEAAFPPEAGPPSTFRLWLRLTGADVAHHWLVLTVPA